jgi:ribonuclease P protein component
VNSFLFPIYKHKIKKTKTYKYVYNGKNRITTNNLLIFYRENQENTRYFGVSITRKVGNSVVRSRIKRILLEALKGTGYHFPNGYSYVFVVKIQQKIASLKELIQEQIIIANKVMERLENQTSKNQILIKSAIL